MTMDDKRLDALAEYHGERDISEDIEAPGPATILTSGPDGLTALCAGRAAVIKI
ncbi:hypothetical protein [Nocardiopsis halotolerans]|uniref:hypothetical protein n=1 Tax=Nocardiopsis halotolerans TaxID=124252 RepID=UPI001360B049|nr:hypothetical protein [Nocardiopsis halotolerans]